MRETFGTSRDYSSTVSSIKFGLDFDRSGPSDVNNLNFAYSNKMNDTYTKILNLEMNWAILKTDPDYNSKNSL